ncbi:oxidoreductase, partial [Escherichia coli]|nr:oxidoreductase [Escherichia coli]
MSLNLELDPLTLRKVFAQHPSGVAALCAELDGEKTGIVASSFTVGVSLEPA